MGVLPVLSSGSIVVVWMAGRPDTWLGDSWGGEGLEEWLWGLVFWNGLGGQASGLFSLGVGPRSSESWADGVGDFRCAQLYALSCFLILSLRHIILKPLFFKTTIFWKFVTLIQQI